MADNDKIVVSGYKDIPPMPVSRGSMVVNDTGSWRNAEPLYIDHTPPCNFKCPAGNDVVGFLRLAGEGKYEEAWKLILETSPLPGICGRVCPHPCESECNRIYLGGEIKIHSIERFLADSNFSQNLPKNKITHPKQKVAVIGSGPAGLSCAWQLNRFGYPVTIFEQHEKAGGMMRVGIPDFRLPKDILDGEIDTIVHAGTEIRTGIEIGKDISFTDLRKEYSAVFIAIGFHKSYSLGIPGEEHPDIMAGTDFLRRIALGERIELKKNVLVIGGGNTAVDTARTAKRLGADVKVIYRRTRNEMPAIPEEVDELLEEKIPLQFLTTPVKIHASGGTISKVVCIKMKLGEPDSSGRRRPKPVEGSNFIIEADQVFTAIGESSDLAFVKDEVKTERWGIPTDIFGRTDVPGIFAGGDTSTGEGTVSHAIGSGRKTALAIKSYLDGSDIADNDLISPSLKDVNPRVVLFEDLKLDYFESIEPIDLKHQSPDERIKNFSEIVAPISKNEALYESQRCMSCGTCPECDNCYVFCPDGAIRYSDEPGKKYLIDIKHCKGCGLCAAECPRYCIELNAIR